MIEKLIDASKFIIKNRRCEEVEVYMVEGEYRGVRFGGNRINQNMLMREAKVNISAHMNKRKGVASADGLSEDVLLSTLRKAEEIARNLPEDPEYMPPYKGSTVMGEIRDVKIPPEEEIADVIRKILMGKGGFNASGMLERSRINIVFVNSVGAECYHTSEKNSISITLEKDGITGYAYGWGDKEPEEILERAYQKIRMSERIYELKPDRYTVIFEPLAFSNILPFLFFSLERREMDEGRSGLSGLLGDKIASQKFTLKSNPLTFNLPRFDEEGIPLVERSWIERGILREAMVTRYWAKKNGLSPTGRYWYCEVEEGDVDDMIKNTERGLLITRLWYIRWVDMKRMILTGMTRDGTFLIEDGEIKGRVKEMRFNDSILSILSSIEAVGGRGERCWREWIPVFTPHIKTKLSFSSLTRF